MVDYEREGALECFQKVITIAKGNYLDTYERMGVCFLETNRYNDALKSLNNALINSPDSDSKSRVYAHLAFCYQMLEFKDDAYKSLLNSVKFNKNTIYTLYENILDNLGWINAIKMNSDNCLNFKSTTDKIVSGVNNKGPSINKDVKGLDRIKQVDNNDLKPKSTFDFRKSKWGMSLDEIKNIENVEWLSISEDLLVYSGKIVGLECNIVYIFAGNKLVRSKYRITEAHSYNNNYISDFENLKKMLITKYNDPSSENQFWNNDLYKDDYQEWGNAIAAGHMSYFTNWSTDSTEICLALMGDNYNVDLSVEYTSKELSGLEDKMRQDNAIKFLSTKGNDFRNIKWGTNIDAFAKMNYAT